MFLTLFYIAFVLGIIPSLLVVIKRKQLRPEIFFIEPYLLLMVVSGFYEWIFTVLLENNSDIWFRSYSLLEFFAIFYFFYRLLGQLYKRFFIGIVLFYLSVFIGLLFVWNTLGHMRGDSVLSVIETIFIYCCCVLWFKNLFANVTESSLINSPTFYFICAFVLYFSGTLFLFLLGEMMRNDHTIDIDSFWIWNIIFNILLRITLIFGIWIGQQKSVRYSG